MKYFTKEWYIASNNEKSTVQPQGKRKKHSKRKTDSAMINYHKELSKIEQNLPECLRSTLHGNIITSERFESNAYVIDFDNSSGFSDIERLFLYDANIIENECDLVGKTWLNEEITIIGSMFSMSALLCDNQNNLYYFTVQFSHPECVETLFTDSMEAGISETLQSVFDISCENAGLDLNKLTSNSFINAIKEFNTYKIGDENLYRYEAGVYNHSCEEFFEIIFTRQLL